MANTIAKSSTVQPKVPRFNRPALCFFLFFLFFYFFRKRKGKQCAGFLQGIKNENGAGKKKREETDRRLREKFYKPKNKIYETDGGAVM